MRSVLSNFEIYYPAVMSLIWITGTLFYEQFYKHLKEDHQKTPPPDVEIMMSCFNEAIVLEDAVKSLENFAAVNFSLTLIDDHSQDQTLMVMKKLQKKYQNIKLIASPKNLGKAAELNKALAQSSAKYILCVDADSVFDPAALAHLTDFMESHPNYGAVTGRPLVQNTNNWISQMQSLEYLMNIDFIKRAQFFFTGYILTVSGVLTLFRREALDLIGGWSPQAMTEDIDATWRLYAKKWKCGYCSKAICFIYVPETVSGFLKQRIRWARGGVEVLVRRFTGILKIDFGQKLLTLEILLSYLWIFAIIFSFVGVSAEYLFLRNLNLRLDILILYYLITLIFYTVSWLMNRDQKSAFVFWQLFWLLPLFFYVYWLHNIIITFVAFYHLFDRVKYAAWGDSDRGDLK